jgi:S-adenosylmethionine hydrolase
MEENKKKIFEVGLIGHIGLGFAMAHYFPKNTMEAIKLKEEEKHQEKIKGEISISLDFNNVDTSINFQELKIYENDMNQTLNFKVKKQKSDFQKRMKNLQNSIK